MKYEDLPEFNSIVTDLNNFDSLLQRSGDQRNRIKTMIVQLRASLHELSRAIDNIPKQLSLTGAESPASATATEFTSSATMPRIKPPKPKKGA